MSDQHMNAGDQGTQPDSGSAPNDHIYLNAAGGSPQGAPSSSGSQPEGETPPIGADQKATEEGSDVTLDTHRKGQGTQDNS